MSDQSPSGIAASPGALGWINARGGGEFFVGDAGERVPDHPALREEAVGFFQACVGRIDHLKVLFG